MAKPSPSQRSVRDISNIRIGERFRKDLGDIPTFAGSIQEVGLVQPVVVTSDGELIAGQRRLAALQHLGREEIPVTVSDVDDIVRAQLAENSMRKGLLPSEIYEVWKALHAEEQAAAKQRQGERRDKHPGNFPASSRGQSRDKIAAYTGVSGRTVEKIVAVCQAAETEPEKYAQLVVDMDRTNKVNGVRKKLKIQRQAEAILREPPPLPGRGPYRALVADVPWPYGADPLYREGASPYPEMSIADICALPVADVAHRDCILFKWTTNRFLREAFQVLDAWGFEYRTTLTWAKARHNALGDWLWGQTEHCLVATRGKPTVIIGNHSTLLRGASRAHSEKPESFYAFVESYAPAPRYGELFARARRPNWDGHGDELKRKEQRQGDDDEDEDNDD